MILGYEVKDDICPCCNDHKIMVVDDTLMCPKCTIMSPGMVLAKILNLTPSMGQNIYLSGRYGSIPEEEGAVYARHNGTIINSLPVAEGAEGAEPMHSYPTMFPTSSAGERSDKIFLTDDISLLRGGPSNLYAFNDWSSNWSKEFIGKEVVIFISRSEAKCRMVSQQLKLVGNNVKVVRYTGNWIQDEMASASAVTVPKECNSSKGLMKMSLKDLIDGYHVKEGNNGIPEYKKSVNAPTRYIVEDVIDWFKAHGAIFLWDKDDNVGYMMFKNEMYPLENSHPKFKSLLWHEGGILRTSTEGASIAEGLCCQAHSAQHVTQEPYINVNVKNNSIEIRQSPTVIKISEGSVSVNQYDKLTYDMITKDRKWFTPINYTEEEGGLELLWPTICARLAVPDVAREILLCWLIGIFLHGYSSIRPGIRIGGRPSTGKSTLLQILHWFFYGKADGDLTSISTPAGLWRKGSVEAVLMLDNVNVQASDFGESLRTFLDLSATGGDRVIGVQGSGTETKSQRANAFVIMSGLDSFLKHDVKTRYFEIETDPEERSDFFAHFDKPDILSKRDIMWSAVFRLISTDVLPKLGDTITREASIICRKILREKERCVDYFLLMVAIGKALQSRGVLQEGDLIERWSDYIKAKSSKSNVHNSTTLSWWSNFIIASATKPQELGQMMANAGEGEFIEMIVEKGVQVGVKGTQNQLLAALSWVARVINQTLPWKSLPEFVNAHHDDQDAWRAEGWEYKEGTITTIRWARKETKE